MRGAPQREPVRSCSGCRKRASKRGLLRVVWSKGRLCWDRSMGMPGRGVYAHKSHSCLLKALTRQGLERSLRLKPGSVSQVNIGELISELFTEIPADNGGKSFSKKRFL